jgi:starch synthase (maltosyl-transferring)
MSTQGRPKGEYRSAKQEGTPLSAVHTPPRKKEKTKPSAIAKPTVAMPADGQVRAVVDAVLPCVDGGRFAVKRIAGEPVAVQVHAFTDGHDAIRVRLRWWAEGAADAAQEIEMTPTYNDVWLASFTPPRPGVYRYTATAWVDGFQSWRHELMRRVDADDIRVAAQVGANLIDEAASRAKGDDQKALKKWAASLRKQAAASQREAAIDDASTRAVSAVVDDTDALKALALHVPLAELADRYPQREHAATFAPDLPLLADRPKARFSSWYEMFPRSASDEEGRHGTFRDVIKRLPYIAEMGFDVLYFPPIHPIGREKRKGKNNAVAAEEGDVGSPWAIGAAEGGHKDILPELGSLEDFRRLVTQANAMGIEIALDIAFQCAPDHPYVKQHPEWFRWRPDGSVQYAENPPKKYQDIYPFNFETAEWRALWLELKSVFDHWIGEGVKIFRVDNPHTKAFAFWEWVIAAVKAEQPDVLFLAEAFTRPKVMHRLAKLGFSQSYTYFTWRNSRDELVDYFTELNTAPGRDYFRPNAWPNTPDILNEHLHGGQRSVFGARLVLAATLAASYGIYGPAFELMDGAPRQPGSEEYLDSEKYQLRRWDVTRADSLRELITRVNRIRKDNPALQADTELRFFPTDNEHFVAYGKRTPDGKNVILTVVNLDPHYRQSGWLNLPTDWFGLEPDTAYQVDDLLNERSYIWRGAHNFVMLDPLFTPAHVFRLRRTVRTERDAESFQWQQG